MDLERKTKKTSKPANGKIGKLSDRQLLFFAQKWMIAAIYRTAKNLHYYSKFGFENEGLSGSDHGGATWYQMRITF